MTKVEELRAKLIDGRGMLTGRARDLDDLLVAQVADVFPKAKAEGVTEGEAKVMGEIKQLAQGTEWFDMLSVLAPTKEAKHGC